MGLRLVGRNKSGARLYGYATGDINQPFVRSRIFGGLVGENESGATIVGYATGDIKIQNSSDSFGGLVGLNQGTVIGYATGSIGSRTASISGDPPRSSTGGLVGSNKGSGVVIGYASTSLRLNFTIAGGGLVGYSENNSQATGYSRSNLTHTVTTNPAQFGRVFGYNSGTLKGYYSGKQGESVLTGGTPNNLGTAIKVDASTTKANFGLFTFGTEVGQWTFVQDKWPAINLPPEVGGNYAPEDQPIDP